MKEIIKELKKGLDEIQPSFNKEKNKIMSIIPDYLLDISINYDLILAGGAVTSVFSGNEVNDLDIYITNEQHLIPFVIDLLHNSTIITVTDKSLLVNHSGQLINVIYFKTFKDANDIFNSFDFTCVMGAFSLKDEEFTLHKNFLKDLAKRELVFNKNTDFPIMSALRVDKYKGRGYTINKNNMVSIILRCMLLEVSSYDELENQIGGMYGVDLSEILDKSKPFNMHESINAILTSDKDISSSDLLKIREHEDVKRKRIFKNLFKGVKFSLYSGGGNVYSISNNRLYHIKGIDSEHIKETEKLNGDVLLYKFVKKTDKEDEFESYWRKEFKYKVGEVVTSDGQGIWGGCLNQSDDFPNRNKTDKVLIEMSVNVDDITCYNRNDMQFTKAKVVRVMKGTYVKEDDNDFNIEMLF